MPEAPPTVPAIVADGVSKSFRVPNERVHTLKERALHPLRRTSHREFRALRDVTFAVESGEFFGICGRNGSGKSTLLKCLAGIYGTDQGRIWINGRMSTFIELGVGFNPDLPARDNVMLNATMLGLSPREARTRYDAVIDFAELREFAELKIKNYSSGMLVRLAFAVMIQVDAEVLLIDEVLAVGDASFQQKCFDQFERIRARGSTVILVTHDMGAIRRFCDRAMLLENGREVVTGSADVVGNRYLELNFSAEARAAEQAEALEQTITLGDARSLEDSGEGYRYGDGRAQIERAWVCDATGTPSISLHAGERSAFVAEVRFHEDVEHPLFSFNITNGRREQIISASTVFEEPRLGSFKAGELVTFRVEFENVLAQDRYWVTAAIAEEGQGLKFLDFRERMFSITVTNLRNSGALVELPYTISLDRQQRASTPEEIS